MLSKRHATVCIAFALGGASLLSCERRTSMHYETFSTSTGNHVPVQKEASFITITNIGYSKNSTKSDDKWHINIELTNNKEGYVAITSVVSGCNCIKVTYDKEPVKPFQKLNIEVVYTPPRPENHFRKSMMVLFNDGKYYKIINLQKTAFTTSTTSASATRG